MNKKSDVKMTSDFLFIFLRGVQRKTRSFRVSVIGEVPVPCDGQIMRQRGCVAPDLIGFCLSVDLFH